MKLFFDENLSKNLSCCLGDFVEEVVHLEGQFPLGTKDEVWLQFVGASGFVLITKDDRIRYNPAEKAAIKAHKVKAVILRGKGLSRWEILRMLVLAWPKIEEQASKTRGPFIFALSRHGQLVRVPLD